MRRKIIKIDEEKCTGCGLCVPSCAEGAIKIVDGKARLVSEKYCDGLGACLGECPEDAITIEEREADEFDEEAVKEHLKQVQKPAEAKSQPKPHFHAAGGCPSSKMLHFAETVEETHNGSEPKNSLLRQWPLKINLVPPNAPYFQDAWLVVAADCAPFALRAFQSEFMAGNRAITIGCPKMDDVNYYIEKLTQIFKSSNVQGVTVVHMEVPCCYGLLRAVETAIQNSGKDIPLEEAVVSIRGEVIRKRQVEAVA
ncbi:MAG: 4Fe-4S binding protein [bacterium]